MRRELHWGHHSLSGKAEVERVTCTGQRIATLSEHGVSLLWPLGPLAGSSLCVLLLSQDHFADVALVFPTQLGTLPAVEVQMLLAWLWPVSQPAQKAPAGQPHSFHGELSPPFPLVALLQLGCSLTFQLQANSKTLKLSTLRKLISSSSGEVRVPLTTSTWNKKT